MDKKMIRKTKRVLSMVNKLLKEMSEKLGYDPEDEERIGYKICCRNLSCEPHDEDCEVMKVLHVVEKLRSEWKA